MHPRTIATLDDLRNASWFSRVGVKDTDTAIVLSSWQKAIAHCSTREWENLNLDASNTYCEHLVQRSPERFKMWNEIVVEVKKVIVPLVRQKIDNVVHENALPPAFEATVRWDILGVCMEAEYADVYKPGWFAAQAYWYVNGHFPCGWDGEYPKGMLVIY
jgi:hypothetical protein